MQQLPPPGWYPDPWNAGRSWRWWDGAHWSVAEHTFHPEHRRHLREQAQRAGHWVRAAFACGAIVGVFSSGLEVARVSSTHDLLFQVAPGVASPTPNFGAILVVALLVGVVNLAVIGIEIWWVLRIGEFAEASGWRATRNRTLGAWSFLIPIVNYWFPYQAIRDAHPPDRSPADVLRWWLWYVLGPLCTGVVLTAVGILGNVVLIALALAGATAIHILIAVLGWQLVDELDATQDEALAAVAA